MTSQAPAYFRAVAIDYDATLADGQVKPDTLAALAEARARQIRVILVTGRIMCELRAVVPDAWDHVDAIVAEMAPPGPASGCWPSPSAAP